MANKSGRLRRKSSFHVPKEIEATLVICSEEPQEVVRQIADVPSIANYRLVPRDAQRIHDFYLDTADQELQAQKLALRVRGIRATRWLTLKGPSLLSEWGSMERLEIEEPWSQHALNTVIKELSDRGVETAPHRLQFNQTNPLHVLSALGLEVIQERETLREIRNVVRSGEESGPLLAELAIDSVTYRLSAQRIPHYEVEIEVKGEGDSQLLKELIESLSRMHGSALRKWEHSKLATGKAIDDLIKEGVLEALLDSNNNLKPVAYDRIDSLLRRGAL